MSSISWLLWVYELKIKYLMYINKNRYKQRTPIYFDTFPSWKFANKSKHDLVFAEINFLRRDTSINCNIYIANSLVSESLSVYVCVCGFVSVANSFVFESVLTFLPTSDLPDLSHLFYLTANVIVFSMENGIFLKYDQQKQIYSVLFCLYSFYNEKE